jgi:uncharacterized protein
MTDEAAAPKRAFEPKAFGKSDFHRLCREWHGYLSALAFIALIFFSATGILLNHPGLLGGEGPAPVEKTFTLDAMQIAAVRGASVPGEELARIADGRVKLAGAYSDGELAGDDVFVRMLGVRGTSDVRANLATGEANVYVERAPAVGMLNELHRGERAGDAWRLFIDIIAAVLIITSLIGFVLFLSLRFRLVTSMILTGAGLLAMVALFVGAVP